jgi:hypothetical protein
MKRRKKYRPKPVLANPLGYVMEGMTSIPSHGEYLLDLNIKHHNALAKLARGEATRADMDTLISGANMTEALLQQEIGVEYADVVGKGMDALFAVASRGAGLGRFILRAEELTAINLLFELHEAQLDNSTIKHVERAMSYVEKELRAKRVRVVAK